MSTDDDPEPKYHVLRRDSSGVEGAVGLWSETGAREFTREEAERFVAHNNAKAKRERSGNTWRAVPIAETIGR